MRTPTPAAVAALAGATVGLAQLIVMQLASGTLRLNTSGWDLQWAGETWLGTRGVGSIDPIDDQPGEPRGLQFTMPGIASSDIALVLIEPVQGRPVNLYTAVFNSSAVLLDVVLEWSGRLDTLNIAEDGERATVTATAEHIGLDLLRPSGIKFSHRDQQRRHPGDAFFEYLIDQADANIVWPAAAFFKQ